MNNFALFALLVRHGGRLIRLAKMIRPVMQELGPLLDDLAKLDGDHPAARPYRDSADDQPYPANKE